MFFSLSTQHNNKSFIRVGHSVAFFILPNHRLCGYLIYLSGLGLWGLVLEHILNLVFIELRA